VTNQVSTHVTPDPSDDPGRAVDTSPVWAYAELSRIVLAAQPLGAVLHQVAELAVKTVPGADDASITLIERGRPRSVAFSGQLAVALDERQYEAGFGPCMDAAASAQMVTVEDTGDEPIYPEFARQAHRHGIRHVLAIGMPTMQGTSGALNIYGAGQAGPFDAEARAIATSFATYAAVAMINAAMYTGALEEVAQMRQALATRAVIEQAKGVIMREHHCSAEQAFARLREMSSRSNRKLRDIAEAIVSETVNGRQG
jgi:GAF domain-containing protein